MSTVHTVPAGTWIVDTSGHRVGVLQRDSALAGELELATYGGTCTILVSGHRADGAYVCEVREDRCEMCVYRNITNTPQCVRFDVCGTIVQERNRAEGRTFVPTGLC